MQHTITESGQKVINIGNGEVTIGLCRFDDGAERSVFISRRNERAPVGTEFPELMGKRVDEVGETLAIIRIANAAGAHVLIETLQEAITNASKADASAPV